MNFLGIPYESGPKVTAATANKQYVITLIKNDMAFSDAYIVLGDILFTERNYQMALRSYHRATDFSGNYELVNNRVQSVLSQWRAQNQQGFVIERGRGESQIRSEIAAATSWLETYQEVEAERLESGEDVSFSAMSYEMARRSIRKPKMIETAYYRGAEIGPGGNGFSLPDVGFWLTRYWYVMGIGAAVGLIVLLRINRHRHQRFHPRKPASR